MTIGKHPLQLFSDQPAGQPPSQSPERRLVLNLVPQDRSSLAIIEESMAMIPVSKGARFLAVCEQMWWLVFGVNGYPADRKQPQPPFQQNPAAGLQRAAGLYDLHLLRGRDQVPERPGAFVKAKDQFRRGGNSGFPEKIHA